MSGHPDSIERKESIARNRRASESALYGPVGRPNVGAWRKSPDGAKAVALPPMGGQESPEPAMALEALRRVYGASNVSAVTERGQAIAFRVRIGDRNVTLRPSEALARMRRTDSVKYLRTRYANSPRGIVGGSVVSFAEASGLPMSFYCGIPDCPHDGVRLHADRSAPAVIRSARDILRRSRADRSTGSERGHHPRGSRNAEVLASEAPSLFCAAHGNRFPCPEGCAES